MGMVKRVLYIPTWGSCRDPEAVSWSRNKTGAMNFNQCFEDPYRDLQNILCLEENKRNSPNVSANFLVFARDAIS